MALVKPTDKWSLAKEYGGIFWHYWEGDIYGVTQNDNGFGKREIVKLTDGEESAYGEIDTASGGILTDSPIRSAQFISGQVGLASDFETTNEHGWHYVSQQIFWYWFAELTFAAERRLWDGVKTFAVREEGEGNRVYLFQGSENGNIIRWRDGAYHDPGKTGQYLPFDGGIIGGMDVQDCFTTDLRPYLSPNLPVQMLILATRSGNISWFDITDWNDTNQVMKPYKSFMAQGATNIQDICIDRNENILYILNGSKTLLKFELEPFGTEEGDQSQNTPAGLILSLDDPTQSTVLPGVEVQINGYFTDMWDVPIQRSGIEYDLISGAGLGKFKSGSDMVSKKTGITGADGAFSEIYKGDE